MSRGYLNAASGQPLHPAAQQALSGFADRSWADPQSTSHEGRLAAQLLEASRATAATVIGVRPAEVRFRWAGADVAKQTMEGLAGGLGAAPVIISAVERDAVLRAAEECADERRTIPVDACGTVSVPDLAAALRDGPPAVVAVQAGNVEIGTVQPLAAVSELCAASRSPLVVDATGALGFVEINPGWTALFADAYSWAGPRHIGVTAIRREAHWRSASGDARLPDIDDVAGAAAAAAALDAIWRNHEIESARLSKLIDLIRAQVGATVPDVDLLGDPALRLPHTVTFSFLYADGELLSAELDRAGFAVGSGSACAARSGLTSHVLEAIGALTHGNVRVSLPIGCPEADVERFLAVLPGAVAAVREQVGAPS